MSCLVHRITIAFNTLRRVRINETRERERDREKTKGERKRQKKTNNRTGVKGRWEVKTETTLLYWGGLVPQGIVYPISGVLDRMLDGVGGLLLYTV